MRSELKPDRHRIRQGESVVEIWFDGELLGTITAADGPGFKIISKHISSANAGPLLHLGEDADVLEIHLKRFPDAK